jgi:hypothetical protein
LGIETGWIGLLSESDEILNQEKEFISVGYSQETDGIFFQ